MADLYKSEYSRDHDIPLAHLDYPHIEKCNNLKELEKILKVLRSGDEGRYPHLEEFCEKKIESINPKSRILRKSQPVSTPRDVKNEEWSDIEKDLKNWQSEMKQVEQTLKSSSEAAHTDLPPVRGSGASIDVETKPSNQGDGGKGKKKRVKPRDYREWDKIDIDAELEKVDNNESVAKENKTALRQSSKPDIPSTIESSNLTDQEKIQKAEREKEKGNEAFRSADFSEALVYYNRSLSLIPTVACRNNRAQTYIKLERWDEAVEDCSVVLKSEPENMKALLRRAVAHQGKRDWVNAQRDLQNVLKIEPGNKRAAQILSEVEKAVAEKKKQGRRMVIEEVEEIGDNTEQEELTKSASPRKEKPKIQEISSAAQEKITENSAQPKNESVPDSKPQGKKGKHKNRKKKNKKEKEATAEDIVKGDQKPPPENATNVSSDKSEEKVAAPTVIETQTKAKEETVKSSPPARSAHEPAVISPPAPMPPVPMPASPPAPMPADVEKIKTEGNDMFRKGRYGEARDLYSKAIDKLLTKRPAQDHNLCLLLSNRGNCYTKMGDMESCAKDCNAALEINPAAIKPLVRRAAAYEAMERYRKAYTDYRQVLYLDRSLDVANQGLNRCSKMLQQMDGPKWREKLPPMKIVSAPASFPAPAPTTTPAAPSPTPSPIPAKAAPSAPSPSEAAPSAPSPSKAAPSAPSPSEAAPPVDKEAKFEELKGKGNQCVQKGEFTEAVGYYTDCIQLFSNRTVPYTNRALCNLRLNKPDLVISDCTTALSHEPNNVKAMFRRAQALKMQEDHMASQVDLERLLKIDPKNAPAKRELQLVKNYIAESKKRETQNAAAGGAISLEERRRQIEAQVEETRRQMEAAAVKVEHEKKRTRDATAAVEKNQKDLAAATAAVDKTKRDLQEDKRRCKIQIEETDESSDEEEAVAQKSKVKVDMSKSTPIQKSETKKPQAAPKQEQQQQPASTPEHTAPPVQLASPPQPAQEHPASAQPDVEARPASPPPGTHSASPPGTHPASPTGAQPTPYEFIHTWSTLKPSMGVAPYAKLLQQIDPTDIPKVISNKLDGDMLSIIIKCVDLFIDQGQASRCLAILQKLVSVPRFEMVTMFMTSQDKKGLNSVLDRIAEWASCTYVLEDLKKLRNAYSLT